MAAATATRTVNGTAQGNCRVSGAQRIYTEDQGGKVRTFLMQLRADRAITNVVLEMVFRNASGGQTGTVVNAATGVSISAGGQVWLVWSGTVPAGTFREQATALARNAPAGTVLHGTAARYDAGDQRSTIVYRDGDSGAPWRWEGTAGQSTSTDDPPPAPVEPTWAPNPATVGTLLWSADTSQADAPAAGYAASGSQRQNGAGQFNDDTVPWPPLYRPAPFGRPGSRALMLRVPDNYRRYEVVPHPNLTFADGDEAWFGIALAVGADTDVAQSDYQVLWQIHGSGPGGSPSVALEASGGRWRLTGGANRPNPTTLAYDTGGTYAYALNLTDELVVERWYHWVFYVGFWSSINSGRVDAWCNGARVLENFRPPCGTNYPPVDAQDSGRAYAKGGGLYHREAIRGGTTWVAEQATGTGYPAVDPTRPTRAFRALDLAAI